MWVLKAWRADLNVPFHYDGDALIYGLVIKTTLDHGWYLNNPSIGMPGGLNMHDYPLADAFNFFIIKLLGLVNSNYAWVLNIFFLLTFPLTAVIALYVFRNFNLSCPSAVVWSVLYTCLPFHFLRGQSHLFITTYYLVPLMVLVALWICSGELLPQNDGPRKAGSWLHRKFILSFIFCILGSSVGLGYYAFFSCFIFLVAGIIALVSQRRVVAMAPAAILIGVIFAGLLANLTPNVIYKYRNPTNPVAYRGPQSAEVYGLKIVQMLLPIDNHRVPALNNLKQKYNGAVPTNENTAAALGLIGSAGFLVLLWWIFFFKPDAAHLKANGTRSVLNYLSLLNIAAVLLATIGGFSSLFALLIWSQIRSYNRISIYIAFFCLLALALLLEDFFRARIQAGSARVALHALLVIVLIIGVLDQTSEAFVPNYSRLQSEFNNDRAFVSHIETTLPPEAMVFQLPYVAFPESPPTGDMTDYELFRGYLHSSSLRWSYGAMKGRESDRWQSYVSTRPTDELLNLITFAGFTGIYMDRRGVPDTATAIETRLSELLGHQPFVSRNQRLLFYDLRDYAKQLRAEFSPEEWQRRSDNARRPIFLEWGGGCFGLEGTLQNNWRWCSSQGELTINNPGSADRRIVLDMTLAAGSDSNLQISSPLVSESLRITADGQAFSKTINLPPGTHSIKFHCDGERIDAPWDTRFMVFKVANFKWKEAD